MAELKHNCAKIFQNLGIFTQRLLFYELFEPFLGDFRTLQVGSYGCIFGKALCMGVKMRSGGRIWRVTPYFGVRIIEAILMMSKIEKLGVLVQ